MRKTILIALLVFAVMAVSSLAQSNETNETNQTSPEPVVKQVTKRGDSGIGFAPCKEFDLYMRKGAVYKAYLTNVRPVKYFDFGVWKLSKNSEWREGDYVVLGYNNKADIVDGNILDLNKDGVLDAEFKVKKDYNGVAVLRVKTECGGV